MFTTTAAKLAAQRQTAMFDEAAEDFQLTAQTAPLHPGAWVGIPGLMGNPGRAGAWKHQQLPGVLIRHCGHPTANRPYHVEGVPGIEGATFCNLTDAKAAAVFMKRDPGAQLASVGVRIVEGPTPDGEKPTQWFHAGKHGTVGPACTFERAQLHAALYYRLLQP